MPTISDINVVKAIAREYIATNKNKALALQNVGYSHDYAYSGQATKLYEKPTVKQAIAELEEVIQADTEAELKHNYEIALKLLNQNIAWLTKKAESGDVQAIQALTAVIRELDCITGLQKQQFITTPEQARELTEAQAKAADEIAAIANRQSIKLHQETA